MSKSLLHSKNQYGGIKKDLKEFERKFTLIKKFHYKKDTDDSLLKMNPNFYQTKITIWN